MTRRISSRAPLRLAASTLGLLLLMSLLLGLTNQTDTADDQPVLLFGIGVHIEPFGAQVSSIAIEAGARPRTLDPNQMNYNRRPDFERHVEDLLNLAAAVELHNGLLTVQAQTAFTTSAIRFDNTILSDFEDSGHEIGLHFHENVHLGNGDENLSPDIWTAVMREEIELIHRAGVENSTNYWSGGNLYPQVLQAATDAGLFINSDWKNPTTQSTPELLMGVHPWRPAGGADGQDIAAFTIHDPEGSVIFLPGGIVDPVAFANKNLIKQEEGLEGWLDVLEEALLSSLDAAQSDRINVFHFTVHPGEFVGDPNDPYEILSDFLDDVIDPLVASGRVQWATFSQMAEAFEAWEAGHPGVDPRP
jgi:hypothetical protein